MKWDHYDYRIAEHYISALINGDQSGIGRMLKTRENTGVSRFLEVTVLFDTRNP